VLSSRVYGTVDEEFGRRLLVVFYRSKIGGCEDEKKVAETGVLGRFLPLECS